MSTNATLTPELRTMLTKLKGRGVIRPPKAGRSRFYTIRYSVKGEQFEESTHSELKSVAVLQLNKKLGAVGRGEHVTPEDAKLTFEDMEELLVIDYKINKQNPVPMVTAVNGLRTSFAGALVRAIDGAFVARHIKARVADDYANATINRELSALQRMFTLLGHRVPTPPTISKLKEDNTRSGFFERAQLDLMIKCLDPDLRDVAHVAYITGWRVWDELLTRKWSHVDWNGRGLLRLDPGETKNKAGRNFPMVLGLRELLERRHKATRKLERETGRIIPWIFYRAARFNGSDATTIVPIRHKKWYYETWHAGCEAAGVDRIPHDFRRTAIRNLEMAGVPTKDAMAMVGHKTMSVYKRYAIADSRSMEVAAEKLDTYLAAEEKASKARVKQFRRR